MPRWFQWLLAASLAGAALLGLVEGVVPSPSSHGGLFSSDISRAEQPALYWLLVITYAAGAVVFFAMASGRLRLGPEGATAAAPPRAPPAWARALAWGAIVCGVILIGVAVMFHRLDPLMGLMFVAIFGGGGLFIALAGLGYLLTGRWH
jgi:hypothetical protein